MIYAELVQPLLERRDLSTEQAIALMRFLVSGDATEAQIGGVLIGLRMKGCTTDELASFASVLREKAASVSHPFDDLVDTCGTGGGAPSFNISTAAAIVAAAAGVRIAKHGNRAVTSKCGSADVLEALGIRFGADPEQLMHSLETVRIIFMFAPAHHSVMRFVGNARKELGVRTVFNQLGPLVNPAGATRQLIGVYDAGLMRSMAEALRQLGAVRALIVHGKDGLDEISPVTETEFVKVIDGKVVPGTLHPRDFGLEPLRPSALEPGASVEESALILREALDDQASDRSKAVMPSAAATIWLSGLEENYKDAAERARVAVSSGAATRKLEELIQMGDGH